MLSHPYHSDDLVTLLSIYQKSKFVCLHVWDFAVFIRPLQSTIPDPAQLVQSTIDVEMEQSALQDPSKLVQSTDDVEFEQSCVPDPVQLMQSKDVVTEQLAAEPLETKLFYGSRRRQKCKVTIKDCDMRKSAQPRARKKPARYCK